MNGTYFCGIMVKLIINNWFLTIGFSVSSKKNIIIEESEKSEKRLWGKRKQCYKNTNKYSRRKMVKVKTVSLLTALFNWIIVDVPLLCLSSFSSPFCLIFRFFDSIKDGNRLRSLNYLKSKLFHMSSSAKYSNSVAGRQLVATRCCWTRFIKS